MSELMKSLAQSEQGYRSSQPSASVVIHHEKVGESKPSYWLLICLCILPPIASVGYLGVKVDQSWQQELELANHAIEQQQELANKPVESPVRFLTYLKDTDLKSISDLRTTLRLSDIRDNSVIDRTAATPTIVGLNSATQTLTRTEVPSTNSQSSANNQSNDEWNLESLDLSELSPELALKVQGALDGGSSLEQDSTEYERNKLERIELVNYEYRFKGKLPAMNLETHMYSSSPDGRWVKINGVELHEGNWLNETIQLLTITPRYITIAFQGEVIEIPALYEWQG